MTETATATSSRPWPPPYVGIGFAEAHGQTQPRVHRACVQFPPYVSLQDLLGECQALGELAQRLTSLQPPNQGQE